MKTIKVLGPGCKRCQTTADMLRTEADRFWASLFRSRRSPTMP